VRKKGKRRGPRVGLLGGSFNPAHDGHRHISEAALRALRLHQVWWLVSPQNPLKSRRDMAPLDRRLDHAAAVADHPRIRPLAIERTLGSRYTVDTLRLMRRRYPHYRFVWLMGADNLVEFPAWRGWTRIFNTVPIAVFDRPSYSHKALVGQAARRFKACRLKEREAPLLADQSPPAWVFLHVRRHQASATQLRRQGCWDGGAAGKESGHTR